MKPKRQLPAQTVEVEVFMPDSELCREIIGSNELLPPAAKMPDDEHMAKLICECRGVIAQLAIKINQDVSRVSEHIAARPALMRVCEREAIRVKAALDFQERDGIIRGDADAIRLSFMRAKLAADMGVGLDGNANGGGGPMSAGSVVDFTREVESVQALTDAELCSLIRRRCMAWSSEISDGTPCPVCGGQQAKVSPESNEKENQ